MHCSQSKIAKDNCELTGYMHTRYAESHRDFGSARRLHHCQGWLIQRSIPGYPDSDGMGCYPLFACTDWSQLHLDLEELEDAIISVALVTDPFGNYDENYLRKCFPDVVIPFKKHYVINLEKPRDRSVSKHHLRYARKALRQLSVEIHPDPPAFLDAWMKLHEHLIVKHNIKTLGTFSKWAFGEQLATPGMVLLWAGYKNTEVAAILFFVHGDVAYGHALGYTREGYDLWAQYALIWFAIEHFTGKVEWIDLMGVPGLHDAGSPGIRQFKEGWTRETRMAWFCGSVRNRTRYNTIVQATRTTQATYFPAYRDRERV